MTITANSMFAKATSSLKGRLIAPHQHDGVKWMIERETAQGPKGGILADEMGLGKTVQSIATTLANPQGQTLIVVPKSLQLQWCDEIEKYTGIAPQKWETRHLINDVPYVVATYGQTHCGKLQSRQWHRLILDEAHTLRNTSTKTTQKIMAIPRHITWCLTGTPIVRHKQDVATLLSLIGETRILDNETVRQTYILRRTFKDLCEICPRLRLPGLTIETHEITMTDDERAAYNNVITYGQFAVRVAESMALDGGNRREAFNHIFEIILRLQQLVVSPHLCREAVEQTVSSVFSECMTDSRPRDEDRECPICMNTMEEPCQTPCNHWFCPGCISTALAIKAKCPMCVQPVMPGEVRRTCVDTPRDTTSTKVQTVLDIVSRSNEKTIVYTHWIKEQQVIRTELEKIGRRVHVIDGSTPQQTRHDIVSDFNTAEDPCVLVANIQTTSAGLNLQAAKAVVFPSLDWSPCNELQAIARVHRLGVEHPVTVHRITAPGTIDDRVQQRQLLKLGLASDLLGDARIKDQLAIKNMTLDDIKSIFTLV